MFFLILMQLRFRRGGNNLWIFSLDLVSIGVIKLITTLLLWHSFVLLVHLASWSCCHEATQKMIWLTRFPCSIVTYWSYQDLLILRWDAKFTVSFRAISNFLNTSANPEESIICKLSLSIFSYVALFQLRCVLPSSVEGMLQYF